MFTSYFTFPAANLAKITLHLATVTVHLATVTIHLAKATVIMHLVMTKYMYNIHQEAIT